MAPLLQPSLEQFHHAGSFAAEHQETTRTPPRCFLRAEDADIRDLSTPGAASEGSEDTAAAVGDLLTSAH